STCPPSPFEAAEPVLPYLRMQGNETFRIAVRTMGSSITEVMDENGLKPGDIAYLIPHQANLRIIEAIRERLKLSPDRVVTNLEKYGNTSAASIPIALDEAARDGRIKANDIILFVAFGGGLTWASSVLRW
ncbi:MAG: 3-oxoacyl-[acyl-carrier-protein] synthase III C-terminal domain-containing protein, partial [Deltaproteobacteria bacterium]